MDEGVNNARSRHGRPFAKGEGGRPKGSRNKRTLLAEQLMEDDLQGVVAAVIAAAKNGDMTACRVVLERLSPARKTRPVTFELSDDVSAASLAGTFASVLRAVAEGAITPDEAAAVGGLLETRRRTIEAAESEVRLMPWSERNGR